VDVGIATADIGSVGDISDLNVLGIMHDGRDDLSTIEVGAKFGTQEMMALTGAVLLPTGDADDPGISIGAMRTMEMESGLTVNNWLQATLLEGYPP